MKEATQTREVFAVTGRENSLEVTVVLDSFEANNYFATNLELTGYANWFGSINICQMIGADAASIFPEEGCRLLELGSGSGRAGIMAAKTMAAIECKGRCVLTDGEEELVKVLAKNCALNGISGVSCRQLWWGENSDLKLLKREEPEGFDVIIGADLIYGPEPSVQVTSMFYTVKTLLSLRGRFYLAFTKRETISIEEVLRIADRFGLEYSFHEDFTIDVFENNVTSASFLWRDTILIFSPRPKEDLSAIDQASSEG